MLKRLIIDISLPKNQENSRQAVTVWELEDWVIKTVKRSLNHFKGAYNSYNLFNFYISRVIQNSLHLLSEAIHNIGQGIP